MQLISFIINRPCPHTRSGATGCHGDRHVRTATFTAVGDDADVRSHAGPQHRADRRARTWPSCPGLTDSHFHPFWGAEATQGVDLTKAMTLDDLRALLRAERARIGPDAWVIGWGLTFEMFQETGHSRRHLRRRGRRRTGLPRASSTATPAVASPAAIAYRRRDRSRDVFPDFATVVVDEHGVTQPASCARAARWSSSRALIPVPTAETKYGWYIEAMKKWNAVGLTGIHAMDGSPETFDLLRTMEERGRSQHPHDRPALAATRVQLRADARAALSPR